jgi:hypothetical protein
VSDGACAYGVFVSPRVRVAPVWSDPIIKEHRDDPVGTCGVAQLMMSERTAVDVAARIVDIVSTSDSRWRRRRTRHRLWSTLAHARRAS